MTEEPLLKLYTEREAAGLLGISHSTVKRHRRANRISHYRVGERVIYSSDHLANFASRRRSQ